MIGLYQKYQNHLNLDHKHILLLPQLQRDNRVFKSVMGCRQL